MNFMLTCALFVLTLASSLASHVEYIDPLPAHRTVHVVKTLQAPIVQSVHHHVKEVPVPVPVPVETPVAVPVVPVAPVVPVEPVVEEYDPFLALLDSVKAKLFGKHLLRKRSVDFNKKIALLHRKYDHLSHLKHD